VSVISCLRKETDEDKVQMEERKRSSSESSSDDDESSSDDEDFAASDATPRELDVTSGGRAEDFSSSEPSMTLSRTFSATHTIGSAAARANREEEEDDDADSDDYSSDD